MLIAQDDPAALADLRLRAWHGAGAAAEYDRQIESALAAGDTELAASFVALAEAEAVAISPAIRGAVADAQERSHSAARGAVDFAQGFVTGSGDSLAALSGTVASDLTVYGDIRDLVREGRHAVEGAEVDRVMVGLAAAGIAITAGTYASAGVGLPARAGVTLLKDARKAGRLGTGLGTWAGRAAREAVDMEAVARGVVQAATFQPVASLRTVRTAVRADKAGALVHAAGDVGRIRASAGLRAAFDGMKIAEGPADLARAARLAQVKGPQTRAILKVLGRGALVLGSGALTLASWLASALMLGIGFLVALKAAVERGTWRYLQWRKRRMRAMLPPAGLVLAPAVG